MPLIQQRQDKMPEMPLERAAILRDLPKKHIKLQDSKPKHLRVVPEEVHPDKRTMQYGLRASFY
jgi:hypothetical protein